MSKQTFEEAVQCEVVWKNAELKRFCVELVRRALESSEPTFTTDLVPDEVRGTGTGMAGSAIGILKTANVIEPVGHNANGKFYPDKVMSTREGRHSAYVSVYRLVSPALAREFLRRNGVQTSARPTEGQPHEYHTQVDLFNSPRLGALAN